MIFTVRVGNNPYMKTARIFNTKEDLIQYFHGIWQEKYEEIKHLDPTDSSNKYLFEYYGSFECFIRYNSYRIYEVHSDQEGRNIKAKELRETELYKQLIDE